MSIQIEFLGAAGNVTGSRTLIRFEGKRYLVDCGLFQGSKELRARNWEPFVKDAASLEAAILTHAHLDHSGYLPRLKREGFKGKVFATHGTTDLANVLLRDAAKLQEEDAEYANRTGHSRHKPAFPLFTVKDAEAVLAQFAPQLRDEWLRIDRNLGLRFIRAGHIVGASFVQLSFGMGNESRLVTFSGDIGHSRSKVLRGPDDLAETDVLILESTYGNRKHPTDKEASADLADIASRTFARGGVLVIPAFAVGRAQELIYLLRMLEDEGRIPSVPVILDSPMSVTATEIFLRHTEDHIYPAAFDERSFYPKQFRATQSQDESFGACMMDGPAVVISASGMLSGGRVLHHLKKRLPDEKNTVLFVGYQAEGSKGRFLLEQGKKVGSIRIHHQEVAVEAEIASIEGLSAHADADEMIAWLSHFKRPPMKVFLNHGVAESAKALEAKIRTHCGWDATALEKEGAFQIE
ncbi:MAG: MBL fold metallo-hydrolase [Bdellovibrionales bacterium]|nr:MBL fold metallo-hydrolase [Bdellovibrionales bacterium]